MCNNICVWLLGWLADDCGIWRFWDLIESDDKKGLLAKLGTSMLKKSKHMDWYCTCNGMIAIHIWFHPKHRIQIKVGVWPRHREHKTLAFLVHHTACLFLCRRNCWITNDGRVGRRTWKKHSPPKKLDVQKHLQMTDGCKILWLLYALCY